MKMVACIIGNLRAGDKPLASLKKKVPVPFDADPALCIA